MIFSNSAISISNQEYILLSPNFQGINLQAGRVNESPPAKGSITRQVGLASPLCSWAESAKIIIIIIIPITANQCKRYISLLKGHIYDLPLKICEKVHIQVCAASSKLGNDTDYVQIHTYQAPIYHSGSHDLKKRVPIHLFTDYIT